jgi:regulator of protease activity HflC (stomatin/prohibitin superfamily)
MAIDSNHRGPTPTLPEAVGWIVSLGVAVLLVAGTLSSFTVVTPGNVGVVFNLWTGSLRTAPQGIVWRVPWFTSVQSYPVALRNYTMVARSGEGSAPNDDSIDLPTREGQHIRQDISVIYNTTEDKAAQVFKSFRGADMSEIESTFVRRTIITAAQNASGQMSLTDIISDQRDNLQAAIAKKLSSDLAPMGFQLDKVNLGASHLPGAIEAQLSEKMAAQQQALQAEYELQKQTTLAKAKVAQAHGDADSTLVKAQAQADANKLLQVTLNPLLIQSKAIDKWNGELPTYNGGGAIPFLSIATGQGKVSSP